jgi:hypothetical protein
MAHLLLHGTLDATILEADTLNPATASGAGAGDSVLVRRAMSLRAPSPR